MAMGQNVQAVYSALVQQGMPPHIAAGMTGNIMQESTPSINPLASGDNGNAFGIAQWNGPRKQALMEFSRAQNADPRELQTQINFLMHELQGPEKGAWAAIQQAPDAETAALIASEKFWRPSIPMNEKRARYASDVYAQLGGSANDVGGMEVTDPELLKMLEGGETETASAEVTDPALIRMLEGEAPEGQSAPPEAPMPADAGQPREMLERDTLRLEGRMKALEGEPKSFWGGLTDSIFNGITFGYGDEIRGLDAAIMGRTPEGDMLDYSRPFWERYNVGFGAAEGERERFKETAPVAAGIGEVGGAIATGGGLARQGVTLVGRGTGVAQKAGLGALESGTYGSIYGSGEAEPDKRIEGAIGGGAAGAAAGGLLTAGGLKFFQALDQRGVIRNAPSIETLRTQAGRAADTARAQGVVYNSHSYTDFVNRLERQLIDLGLDEELTPATNRVLTRLTELRGAQPTFDQIETLRRVVAKAAGAKEPGDRMLADIAVNAIDDFVATPRNVAFANGDAALAAASITEMRRNWSRMRKAEKLDEALVKAERQAGSAGSGGNINNAIRQQIKSILNNPKSRRGFRPEELEVLESVVRGTPARDGLRLLGKIAPQGNGLSLFLNLAAFYTEPAFLAATAAGAGAKFLSDRATQQALRFANGLVRSGALSPRVRNMAPGALPGAGGYAGKLMQDLRGTNINERVR